MWIGLGCVRAGAQLPPGAALGAVAEQIGCLASPLEKATAPHSSALAWKIPWTEEPGRLQSTRLLRVRHD